MAEEKVVQIESLARVRARMRVLHGARAQELTFEDNRPLRVSVGSAQGATLCIERADVAPQQFEVVWDGTQLWLQDALRLGRTFVNGRTLNEWLPVVGQALVCFGGVRLWIRARTAMPRVQAPDFDALDRARLTDALHSASLRLSETSRITLPSALLQPLSEQDVR